MAAQNIAAGAANIPEKRPGGGRRHGEPVVKPRDMKGTLRRLLDVFKGDRKGLVLILIFAVLSSAAGIFSPLIMYFTKSVITRFIIIVYFFDFL